MRQATLGANDLSLVNNATLTRTRPLPFTGAFERSSKSISPHFETGSALTTRPRYQNDSERGGCGR